MKILVIGSGGREHALAVALAQSPMVKSVLCTPGNGGTAVEANPKIQNVANGKQDNDFVIQLVKDVGASMVVVGPEAPLVDGLVDALQVQCPGVLAFGPTQAAAELEAERSAAASIEVVGESRKRGPQLAVLQLDMDENYQGLEQRRADGPSAWVPIQRGCDHRCTFCIIPSMRGDLASRYIQQLAGHGLVMRPVAALADAGPGTVVVWYQDVGLECVVPGRFRILDQPAGVIKRPNGLHAELFRHACLVRAEM